MSQSAVQLSQMTRRFDYNRNHEYTVQGAHLFSLVIGVRNSYFQRSRQMLEEVVP